MSSAPTGRTGKTKRTSQSSSARQKAQSSLRLGKPLRDLIDAGRKSPLLWAIDPLQCDERLASDLELWHAAAAKSSLSADALERLEEWLAATLDPSVSEALRAIQSLDFLPQLEAMRARKQSKAKAEAAESELRLIDLIHRIMERAENVAALSTTSSPDDTWFQLLTSVELPLAIGAVIRRGRASRGRFDGIREATHRLLDDYCDTDGMPHASGLASLRPIVASLVRSHCWASSLRIKLLQHEMQGLFDGLLEHAIRLSRSDRSQLGSSRGEWAWSKRLLERALQASSDQDLALLAYPACRVGKKESKGYVEALRSSSSHSDWSRVSLLRGSWDRRAPKMLVTHERSRVTLELETVLPILEGEWGLSIDRDGKPLKSRDSWSVVCWHEDDGVSYLELERHYDQGTRIQRQVLLGREDEFVFLADAILGTEEASWDYRSELPLCSELQVQTESETRELRLLGSDESGEALTAAAVVPLFLPEWQLPRIDAGLSSKDGKLVAYQHAVASRLYFPIFLDVRPWRATSPLTWRSLTVAEQLKICSPSIAQAFRVQVGWEQWAFYRSLGPAGNRTFFGENLISDFFAGQFDPDDGMNELIRIEEDLPR